MKKWFVGFLCAVLWVSCCGTVSADVQTKPRIIASPMGDDHFLILRNGTLFWCDTEYARAKRIADNVKDAAVGRFGCAILTETDEVFHYDSVDDTLTYVMGNVREVYTDDNFFQKCVFYAVSQDDTLWYWWHEDRVPKMLMQNVDRMKISRLGQGDSIPIGKFVFTNDDTVYELDVREAWTDDGFVYTVKPIYLNSNVADVSRVVYSVSLNRYEHGEMIYYLTVDGALFGEGYRETGDIYDRKKTEYPMQKLADSVKEIVYDSFLDTSGNLYALNYHTVHDLGQKAVNLDSLAGYYSRDPNSISAILNQNQQIVIQGFEDDQGGYKPVPTEGLDDVIKFCNSGYDLSYWALKQSGELGLVRPYHEDGVTTYSAVPCAQDVTEFEMIGYKGMVAFSDKDGVFYIIDQWGNEIKKIDGLNNPYTETTVTTAGNQVSVHVTVFHANEEPRILLVGMQDGKPAEYQMATDGTAVLSGDTEAIKIFVWESFQTLKPVCKEETIVLQ